MVVRWLCALLRERAGNIDKRPWRGRNASAACNDICNFRGKRRGCQVANRSNYL